MPNTIDGGAIVSKDKAFHDKLLLMRDFGIQRSIFRDNLGEISPACDIYMKGYGATLNEVNSYIGCCQMEEITDLLIQQVKNGHYWEQYLLNMGYHSMKRIEVEPNYWVYGLLSNDKRSDLFRFREMGYYASGVHLPNNYYSIFYRQPYLSGVEEFHSRFIALPCGWWFDNKNICAKD